MTSGNICENKLSLFSYGALDTESTARFERITSLLAAVLSMPIALLSFCDLEQRIIRSHTGLKAQDIPAEFYLLNDQLTTEQPLVISDTLQDPRFNSQLAASEGKVIRSFAGIVLKTHSGGTLGSLCAIDYQPQQFNPAQIAAIGSLASIMVDEIELHKVNHQLVTRNWELEESLDDLQFRNREQPASAADNRLHNTSNS